MHSLLTSLVIIWLKTTVLLLPTPLKAVIKITVIVWTWVWRIHWYSRSDSGNKTEICWIFTFNQHTWKNASWNSSMGGVCFGHSYLYFLYISLCTIFNESSVEQFFILSPLDSDTGSKDRTHRLPESECGETSFKKNIFALRKVFFTFLRSFHNLSPSVPTQAMQVQGRPSVNIYTVTQEHFWKQRGSWKIKKTNKMLIILTANYIKEIILKNEIQKTLWAVI